MSGKRNLEALYDQAVEAARKLNGELADIEDVMVFYGMSLDYNTTAEAVSAVAFELYKLREFVEESLLIDDSTTHRMVLVGEGGHNLWQVYCDCGWSATEWLSETAATAAHIMHRLEIYGPPRHPRTGEDVIFE